jgi:hypothetical protein
LDRNENLQNRVQKQGDKMSELIHAKDKGTMIEDNNSQKHVKCGKCGYKVLKSELYNKYDEGLLELPVKR